MDSPLVDPRYSRLLAAARAWRASLRQVPDDPSYVRVLGVLLEAIDAFDAPPVVRLCEHARKWHVFYVDGRVDCGYCGETIALPVRHVTPLVRPPVDPDPG